MDSTSLWGALIRQIVGVLPMAWIFSRIAGLELGMVFVPAGRDTGYSILPDSTEIHIQGGDKKTGYNRREYILMRITEDIRYLYPRCLRS